MHGMPARKLGANFSSMPHTGKLKALMCTATPRRGTRMCVPANPPFRPSGSTGPSCITLPDGSSLVPMPAYADSVPVPPSMSTQPSVRVAPVCADIAYSASFCSASSFASALRRAARCWKSSASSDGTPTRRAWSTAWEKSSASACVRATGRPLTALASTCAPSWPTQRPAM